MSFTENWKRRLRYTRDQERINFTTGIPQLEQQQNLGNNTVSRWKKSLHHFIT